MDLWHLCWCALLIVGQALLYNSGFGDHTNKVNIFDEGL
jgi:hypothetical protein